MHNRTYHLVRIGAITATVLILVLCAGAVRFARQYVWANDWVNHTSDVIDEIRSERMLLTGTVPLSGAALEAKSATILTQLDRLTQLTKDNPVQIENTAEVFRRAVEQRELTSNGKSVGRFTTSIGVATSTDFSHPAELVRAADAALYRAKRMGRNTTWLSGESASEIRELAGRPAYAGVLA